MEGLEKKIIALLRKLIRIFMERLEKKIDALIRKLIRIYRSRKDKKQPRKDLTGTTLKTFEKHLPDDVLEIILSKLPIKSILRFKAVSKEWNDLILSPRFARTHLCNAYYNTKGDDNHHFMWLSYDKGKYHLGKFKRSKVDVVSSLRFPDHHTTTALSSPHVTLCSCDGFFLIYNKSKSCYVLWNPITGSNTSFATYPHDRMVYYQSAHGIYYDSSDDDYKVVCITPDWYTVYSCRDDSWAERKEFPYMGVGHDNPGVSVRGVLYWVFINEEKDLAPLRRKYTTYSGPCYEDDSCFGSNGFYPCTHEIVYFDAAERGFKTLERPEEEVQETDVVHLTSLNGRLCLYQKSYDRRHLKIWVMMQDNNASWTKLTNVVIDLDPRETYCSDIKPLYVTEGHRIIFRVGGKQRKQCLVEYDIRNRTSGWALTFDDDESRSEVVAGIGSLVFPALKNYYF